MKDVQYKSPIEKALMCLNTVRSELKKFNPILLGEVENLDAVEASRVISTYYNVPFSGDMPVDIWMARVVKAIRYEAGLM